jgi:hypothetical protein
VTPASTEFIRSSVRDLMPSMAGPAADERLIALLKAIPPRDMVLLECRITGSNRQIDASISVEQGDLDGRLSLQHWIARQQQAPDATLFHPLAALFQAWDGLGLLAGAVPRIWFEFDLVPGRPVAIPGIFVGVRRGVTLNGHPCRVDRLAMLVLDLLAGTERAARFAPLIEAVVRNLPTGVAVSYLGLFPSRPGAELRLQIALLTIGQVSDYLALINHPTAIAPAMSLLEDAGLRDHELVLALDLGAGIGATGIAPRIGLEVPISSADTGQVALKALLDALVSRKLCAPEQRASMLAWRRERTKDARRTVSHVKLVLSGDGSLDAKIYFTLSDLSASGSAQPVQPAAASSAS